MSGTLHIAQTRRRKKARPEQDFHLALATALRTLLPSDAFFFHPANGGYRTMFEAQLFPRLGAESGLPDIFVIHKGAIRALELKTDTGRLSITQRGVHDRLRAAGCPVEVARSVPEALDLLTGFGIPLRGRIAA